MNVSEHFELKSETEVLTERAPSSKAKKKSIPAMRTQKGCGYIH